MAKHNVKCAAARTTVAIISRWHGPYAGIGDGGAFYQTDFECITATPVRPKRPQSVQCAGSIVESVPVLSEQGPGHRVAG